MTYEDSIFATELHPLEGAVYVLDHGYVKLIESWGSDERIIEAARMSTGKGFLGWGSDKCKRCDASFGGAEVSCVEGPVHDWDQGDRKLLAYLWNHKHMTPFEMAGAVFEVQAPIFVFREWHRHRTQSYNELSSRYTPLPDVHYVPSVDRLLATGKSKQAQGTGKQLSERDAIIARALIEEKYMGCQNNYEAMLEMGVPKELARLIVPVGRYSRMRASANLRNWIQFLTLREDEAAQWEIRQFAVAVHLLLSRKFPRVLDLYEMDR